MIPTPTPIYHITDVSNLSSIVADGGLGCTRWLRERARAFTDIAYSGIQDRRAITQVPCGSGGCLHDYVPFYFAPRSPMLCAIWKGKVEGYAGSQSQIIHLVSTAQLVADSGLEFVFTDGHGIIAMTEFFEDLAHLDTVDWPLMKARYWRDTFEDSDRKRRRQAEFLVRDFFPWTLVHEIGVMSTSIRARVEETLGSAAHRPVVTVHSEWYY